MTETPEEEAFNKTCNFLSFRPRTESEIRRYLTKHNYQEIAEEVVDRLKGAGLIDDKAFAEAWVTERSQTKGYGRRRLKTELFRLGVDSELIDSTIEEFMAKDLEEARANDLARKRWSSLGEASLVDKKRKVYAFLVRRGFSSATAVSAIEAVINPTDASR